jgi:HAD superfamily hydrolase (TIGR01509 family)
MPAGHPPLPRPQAVIIDLDGTLVDTVETRIAAWLRAFDESRIAATRELVAPLIGSDGRWLARRVAGASGLELDDNSAEAIDHRSGEIYDELNTDPRPLPGATELLTALDTRGIPWAIATSSRPQQVAASIRALRLASPPTIVDGGHVARAKPAPDLLLYAARELGIDPSAAWCVGDSTWDMQAAAAAGMVAIGVTSGSASAAVLRDAGADVVIPTLADLALD